MTKMMKLPPTDRSLLQDLAAGRSEAYAALYERFARRMLRVATSMLGRADAAEDVLQDVFLNLARRRQCFLKVEDIEAYVFASLRYAVAARLAQAKREQQHLRQFAMARSEETRPSAGSGSELTAILASLPPEQREVVVLKIDAGLTFAQIGRVLGVSPNTAASRYRYAIEKLRRTIEEPT